MRPEPDLDLLWTAARIAQYVGVGVDQIHAMRRLPGCPIRQLTPGGKLYASRSALKEWLDQPSNDNARQTPTNP